eukprot:2236534-Prymnesium_polylepis.2
MLSSEVILGETPNQRNFRLPRGTSVDIRQKGICSKRLVGAFATQMMLQALPAECAELAAPSCEVLRLHIGVDRATDNHFMAVSLNVLHQMRVCVQDATELRELLLRSTNLSFVAACARSTRVVARLLAWILRPVMLDVRLHCQCHLGYMAVKLRVPADFAARQSALLTR